MGIVESRGDRSDDVDGFVRRHAVWISLAEQPSNVGAIDEIHRNPQSPSVFAAVVDADDVRVPQLGGQVRFPVEPFLVVGACRDVGAEHLDGIFPRQTRMLGEVDFAHSS